jgi:hypothetical protein
MALWWFYESACIDDESNEMLDKLSYCVDKVVFGSIIKRTLK